jgi:hypothetical protein
MLCNLANIKQIEVKQIEGINSVQNIQSQANFKVEIKQQSWLLWTKLFTFELRVIYHSTQLNQQSQIACQHVELLATFQKLAWQIR